MGSRRSGSSGWARSNSLRAKFRKTERKAALVIIKQREIQNRVAAVVAEIIAIGKLAKNKVTRTREKSGIRATVCFDIGDECVAFDIKTTPHYSARSYYFCTVLGTDIHPPILRSRGRYFWGHSACSCGLRCRPVCDTNRRLGDPRLGLFFSGAFSRSGATVGETIK